MMTLRECARMETTMWKCAVSNNVCVQESVLRKMMCVEKEPNTKTPDRREPVPARPERDAHQETAKEDAVCGAEAGRMC